MRICNNTNIETLGLIMPHKTIHFSILDTVDNTYEYGGDISAYNPTKYRGVSCLKTIFTLPKTS